MTDKTNFSDLGLSKEVLRAVEQMGYENPTPVQAQAIPLALQGKDIVAAAKTGTGKTAAFSLPSMDKLGHTKEKRKPLMLVVTPTRELAQQISEVCSTIAKQTNHKVLTVVGGLSYDPQKKALNRGIDVLVATPGRLIDLMDQRAVSLTSVSTLVLDEADRMLDMGFWPSVQRIVADIPDSRQTLLFSATIDKTVTSSIKGILNNPEFVEIAHKGETADTVTQYVIPTTPHLKTGLLTAVLKEKKGSRIIVFTRTKHRADSCAKRLKRAGFLAEAIHSDRTQAQRKRALENFGRGKTKILVATDVLARGIDISEVDYVVNYDLPNQPEDYIHRIGRTGRAGEAGFSISFVSPEQKAWLKDIEKLIKRKIPTMELSAYDAVEAEADAARRATNFAAKKDPELANIAREQARQAKTKKKRKTQAAKLEQPQHKSSKSRKPKQKTHQGAPFSKKGNTGASSKSTGSKNDMRPGRAQRAARTHKGSKR